MEKKEIKILLAEPRGFCAGVVRAIEIVEKALKKYGSPVYVRHEIVHNKHVVEDLKQKGAIFVEELDDIKDNTRPVIFSAHGVPKKVPEEAKNKKMFYVDLTSKDILTNNMMLESNDIIYVAPLRKRFYAVNSITNIISLSISAVSLYLLMSNK